MKSEFSKAAVPSAIYTVIGVDTYWGAHMMRHLKKNGQIVVGIAQDEDFCYDAEPISVADLDKIPQEIPSVETEWIIICVDPRMGFEKYTAKVKKLFDHLAEREFVGDICFFSSSSLCMPDFDNAISENTAVYLRNEHDLALATGENLLTVLGCGEKGYAVPHILRVGVTYGDEIGMEELPYFVNRMSKVAQNESSLRIPLGGEAKRSLTHIADLCEAAIALMNSKACPPLVNIPGEIKTIHEVGSAIAKKYQVEFSECGLNQYGDVDYFAGDQHLSGELFAETVDFIPEYTFEKWLDEQPSGGRE